MKDCNSQNEITIRNCNIRAKSVLCSFSMCLFLFCTGMDWRRAPPSFCSLRSTEADVCEVHVNVELFVPRRAVEHGTAPGVKLHFKSIYSHLQPDTRPINNL